MIHFNDKFLLILFPVSNNTHPPLGAIPPPPQPIGLNFGADKKKLPLRGRITKADIGMPTNFKHVTHVGWSAQRGFDLTGDDVETLKPFLEKAGVSDQQLNDRETRAFIYDFIQNHNVLESVKSESHPSDHLPAPPVPIRSASQQNGGIPKVDGAQRSAPPPPPRTQAPLPPLPSTTPPSRGPPPTRPPPIVNNTSAGPVIITCFEIKINNLNNFFLNYISYFSLLLHHLHHQ